MLWYFSAPRVISRTRKSSRRCRRWLNLGGLTCRLLAWPRPIGTSTTSRPARATASRNMEDSIPQPSINCAASCVMWVATTTTQQPFNRSAKSLAEPRGRRTISPFRPFYSVWSWNSWRSRAATMALVSLSKSPLAGTSTLPRNSTGFCSAFSTRSQSFALTIILGRSLFIICFSSASQTRTWSRSGTANISKVSRSPWRKLSKRLKCLSACTKAINRSHLAECVKIGPWCLLIAMRQNRSKQTDNQRRQRASNPKHKTYDRPGIRSTVYQHHSHPLNRRGATGEVGTSWNTDGARTVGLYDLEPRDALRPRGPDLAQPGSVRAFEWARLDAALVRASPDRNQGGKR